MQPCSVHTGSSEQLRAIKKLKSGKCLQEKHRNKLIAPYTQGLSSAEGWSSKLTVCLNGKRLQMYLFTVNRYVKRDLKVISVSSVWAKPEQGGIWALNQLHGGLFSPFSKGNRNSEVRFCSTQEETTANCLDSCSNLTETGLDVEPVFIYFTHVEIGRLKVQDNWSF